ncbi:DUF1565 domain-containing protein, partial [bacterium]|nr:DUF1565 domain-containing protein [bacterium]
MRCIRSTTSTTRSSTATTTTRTRVTSAPVARFCSASALNSKGDRFVMKHLRTTLTLLLLVAVAVWTTACDGDDNGAGPSGYSTELSGDIGTRTLTAAEGPYGLTGDVLVPEGATLTIEPGVEILAVDTILYKIEVRGTIIAEGDSTNLIRIRSGLPTKSRSDWLGLWLIEASDNSRLEYLHISNANIYNIREDTTRDRSGGDVTLPEILHRGAITIQNCSPTVRRCIIDENGYDGVQVVGPDASPVIEYNTIVMNAFNGVRIEPGWPEQTSFGSPVIANNIIVENDDAGIRSPDSWDDSYMFDIRYNNIWNNQSPDYIPLGMEEIVVGDVHLNPEFKAFEEGDYHLHPCSGSLDIGDPDDPADPDGTRPDVGVFPLYQADNFLANRLTGEKLTLDSNYEGTGDDRYLVTCNVRVEEGDELVIGPGTRIAFNEAFKFDVYGTITAEGTPNNPIVFTSGSDDPRPGDWLQLMLDNASSNSVLRNVVIEYGSVDDFANPRITGALSMKGTSPTLANVT